MIDTQIKDATCQIKCGGTYGSAFLIANSIFLTARHCVLEAIDSGTEISVAFPSHSGKLDLIAKVLAVHEELDACLLSVSEETTMPALDLSADLPRGGGQWQSYGFPVQKGSVGYRASGEIAQVLDAPMLKMDLDLSVSASIQLSSYEGLSGAPVIADGKCMGVLRLRVDGGVGAISTKALTAFLVENGISMESSERVTVTVAEPSEGKIAARKQFQAEFEELVLSSPGQYLFLEGAHGIGKTTFCHRFKACLDRFLTLGTYSFGAQSRTGPAPVVLVQPDYFFDWLSTSISSAVSGRPSRVEEKRYSHLVEETGSLLQAYSEHCKKRGKQGVIFIDALNEGHLADREALAKLIGLLPRSLPADLTIVFTAPNLNQLANALAGYVRQEKVIQLPKLSEGECASYCANGLREERRTPTLIATICQKAKGHPLYLRYLIEFANESEEQELSNFPVLQGTIEEYYESLWNSLVPDADALNLLGLVSRLRWGIPIAELVTALTPSEQAVFVSTMSRVRHLLAAPDSTEIYHASFSEFIRAKTSALDRSIHEKIGRYCTQNMVTGYCALNAVFHLLRSTESSKSEAVALCSQNWIDNCVEIGVDPDTLMLDLKDCLGAAIALSDAANVFRLLLLQQRVGFRYNTLFAKNAFLVADAMIALKKPQDAIRHVIRFDRPIISLEAGLHVSYRLIESGYEDEVFDLLHALNQALKEYRFSNTEGVALDEFVAQTRLELLMPIHANWTDGVQRGKQFSGILHHAAEQIESVLGEDEEALGLCISTIRSVPVGAYLYHAGVYTSVDKLRAIDPKLIASPKEHVTLLSLSLLDYQEYVEKFGKRERQVPLGELLKDFSKLLDETDPEVKYHEGILGVLIELGAPSDVVLRLSKRVSINDVIESPLVKGNNVDVNFDAIHQTFNLWTINGYLDTGTDVPLVRAFGTHDWADSLSQLVRTVAICEGKARRAFADSNEQLSGEVLAILKSHVIEQLDFTLGRRITWENSYAIPESVFPIIYQRVTVILRDCFPAELPPFLLGLVKRMPKQLGLYSEGFRETIAEVLNGSYAMGVNVALNDARYEVMLGLKDFVIAGVENRHELVPELLKLVPKFAAVGAHEEAEGIYRHVLSVSMGPTWYKEDQFGLITSALRHLPILDAAALSLPKVAGFLERASGELTFQRFARYAKSELIGELCRRDLHGLARRYFQRQVCGSPAELLQDMGLGFADRISERMGSRHPGGALDDQHSILAVVEDSLSADWRLRFALLQVYLCGDKRHLRDYAAAFANMIKREADETESVAMRERLDLIIATDVSQGERTEFQAGIDSILEKKTLDEPQGNEDQGRDPEPVPEIDNEDREAFVMPGLFGRRSATQSAETKLATAEGHIKRKNFLVARAEAVAALREFQDGDWSIWGNLSASATRAEEILHVGNADEADLIKSYGLLIENERYADRWKIADHLLQKIGRILSTANATSFWNHALQHVGLMVGDSEQETRLFGFLSEANEQDADSALFELLLWTLDHPQWLRRERAAAAILWIIEAKDDFFTRAAREAFSMAHGYRADVILGAIDTMSKRNPKEIWVRLSNAINVLAAASDCKHVGHLSILLKLATRAAGDDETARQVAELIMGALRSGAVDLGGTGQPPQIPYWAECVRTELRELGSLGVPASELLARTEELLGQLCAPQSIKDAWELENSVSLSFREPNRRVLNRRAGLVRHALACALTPYASQRNIEHIGAVLRIYNPCAPERKLDAGFTSFGERILAAIRGGGNRSDLIGNDEHYYLSYCEFVADAAGEKNEFVEVFATIILHPSERKRAYASSVAATFHSTNLPDLSELGDAVGPTCLRPIPVQSLFGVFSPGVPSPTFTGIVGAAGDDIVQKAWRHGRSFEVNTIGKPESEGCMLGIRKSSVKLPGGSALIWTIMVNGELVIVVDNNLNKLN
jgi:hypothetical protein